MHDREPNPETETMDDRLAAMGGYIERLLKAARLAEECNFPAVEAEIRAALELAHDHLLVVLCAVPDGAPRRRAASMISAVAKALGPLPK
jgi:hypothetical protein